MAARRGGRVGAASLLRRAGLGLAGLGLAGLSLAGLGLAGLGLSGLGLSAMPGASPALAAGPDGEATCAAIAQAVRRVGETEQFHSLLVASTPGRRRPVREERFVLGDIVYTNSPAAGRWVKLPMTAADRHALGAGLEAYPPRDCREDGTQEVGGVPMRIYAFEQALPGVGGSESSTAPGRLWVTAADGRLHRYEGQHGDVRVTLTFDYGAVVPPIGR